MGFAQKTALKAEKSFTLDFQNSAKGIVEVTDTLIPASFTNGTPALYTTQAGGFVFGANGYGINTHAQVFLSEDNTYEVDGVMIWVGANAVDEGNLSFKVWDFTNDSVFTELGSVDVPFAQVTTTTPNNAGDFYYTAMFETPVAVTDSFAVGISFSGISDGFGLLSTKAGDGGIGAWQIYNNSWINVPVLWNGLDVDMGVFALVDAGSSVPEKEVLSQVSIYPNPVNNMLIIDNLEGVSQVVISNVLGQTVINKIVNSNNITINTDQIDKGVYIVTLVTEGGLVRSEKIIKE